MLHILKKVKQEIRENSEVFTYQIKTIILREHYDKDVLDQVIDYLKDLEYIFTYDN